MVTDTRTPRHVLFAFLGAISIALFGVGEKYRPYLAAAIFAAWVNLRDVGSLNSIYQAVCFTVGVFVLHQAVNLVKKPKVILNAICVATIVQASMVILNAFQIDLLEHYAALFNIPKMVRNGASWIPMEHIIPAGGFDNPNISASMLGIGLMAFMRKGWLYYAPFILAGLAISGGVGGLYAASVGAVMLFLHRLSTPFIAAAMAGIGAISVLAVNTLQGIHPAFYSGGRLEVWRWALHNLTWDGWLFGKGLGWWQANSPNFIIGGEKLKFLQLHNEYIELLYSFGIVGIGVFVAVVYKALDGAKHLHPCYMALFGAVLASSFLHFAFHIAVTACIGVLITGILLGGGNVHRLERA